MPPIVLKILSLLAQAATLIRRKHNVNAEAWAVLDSLVPESTLQGIHNARDMVLWQLKASAFELQMVLDERVAMQRALAKFGRAAEEDTGSAGDWGVGGGVGEGEGDDEDEEGDKEEVVVELNE